MISEDGCYIVGQNLAWLDERANICRKIFPPRILDAHVYTFRWKNEVTANTRETGVSRDDRVERGRLAERSRDQRVESNPAGKATKPSEIISARHAAQVLILNTSIVVSTIVYITLNRNHIGCCTNLLSRRTPQLLEMAGFGGD